MHTFLAKIEEEVLLSELRDLRVRTNYKPSF